MPFATEHKKFGFKKEASRGVSESAPSKYLAVGADSELTYSSVLLPDDVRRQRDLLSALKLPVTVPAEMQNRRDEIVGCMMLDKKTEGRELRFVLPSRIGHVETVRGVSPDIALRCL